MVQRVPRGFGRHGGSCTRSSSHVFQQSPKERAKPSYRQRKKESLQIVRQQEGGLKIREEQPGDKMSVLQPGRPTAWDLSYQEVTECLRASRMCKTSGSTDPTDLASFGEEEHDGSMKLKEHVGWWEAELNENERRDFPSGPEMKRDQRRIGQCAGVKVDLEASVTEPSGGRGTGLLSHAAEQDACLLHENGSDQSMYSCPSPTDEGGDDLENMAASPPLQAWFDTEVFEVPESDDLDVVAATEQHSKTAFRSDVQKRSQTAPNPSRVLILGRLRVSSP